MNRVDGVILGVGVVVLVASIIGVILYDEEGGTTFDVTWADGAPIALEEQSGSGTSQTFTFAVTETGIARVDALVEATANGLRLTDDAVSVTIEGPGGLSATCPFSMAAGATGSGSCTAAAAVQDAPSPTTANGASAEEAETAARGGFTSTAGQGDWTVTVTITPGAGAPGPGAAGYTVILTPQVVEWEPNAAPPTPDAV